MIKKLYRAYVVTACFMTLWVAISYINIISQNLNVEGYTMASWNLFGLLIQR